MLPTYLSTVGNTSIYPTHNFVSFDKKLDWSLLTNLETTEQILKQFSIPKRTLLQLIVHLNEKLHSPLWSPTVWNQTRWSVAPLVIDTDTLRLAADLHLILYQISKTRQTR